MITEKENGVRHTLARMEQMFQNPTAELFQQLFTQDCSYITFDGNCLQGIEANFRIHQQLASMWIFKRVRLEGEVVSIKFLNDQTAVAIVRGALVFRWQKKASSARMSINTNVMIFDGSQWKVCAFQNTRIKQRGWLRRLFTRS
jgi:uncharacterized protein (TIGR02246 family)